MTELRKTGLVLSGGGARGAYQAGVLRALHEMNIQVDMVSGASIGALNAGVLAGAPTFSKGLMRVEKLWETLMKASPIKVNQAAYVKLMLAAGAVLLPQARLLLLAIGAEESPLLSDEPLSKLMDEYLDTDKMAKGLPLYISVYKSLGRLSDISQCFLAAAGVRDTPESDFLHLQSLPVAEQRNALMASAALPMLFQARKITGTIYSDGGQGGWSKSQGNTPIQPLIDAGCKQIIVTHLSNGSFWSRHDFPGVNILEVRPDASMARSAGLFSGARDLLGFDADKIPTWIEQGYNDTKRCVGRVKQVLELNSNLKYSKQAVFESEVRAEKSAAELEDLLSKLLDSNS